MDMIKTHKKISGSKLHLLNTSPITDMDDQMLNLWNTYVALHSHESKYWNELPTTKKSIENISSKIELKQKYIFKNTTGKRSKLSLAFSIGVLSSLIATSMIILPYPFNLIVGLAIGGPLSVSILAYRR